MQNTGDVGKISDLLPAASKKWWFTCYMEVL